MEPVPFFIYDSRSEKQNNLESYTEEECRKTGLYIPRGHDLMQILTADDSAKEAAKLVARTIAKRIKERNMAKENTKPKEKTTVLGTESRA